MSQREPTRDELLAMAYADGELNEADRREFETRMATEKELVREVAELKRLAVLARQLTPREPKDFEWQKLEGEFVHRAGSSLGLLLSAVGALGALAWMFYALLVSELEAVPKTCFALLLVGLTLVFLVVLRARLRMAPNDPYSEVER